MRIRVRLSGQHYIFGGRIYSSDKICDSPLAKIVSTVSKDTDLSVLAKYKNLILPGTLGMIIGTTAINSALRYVVQFEGAQGPIPVPGKFIEQV